MHEKSLRNELHFGLAAAPLAGRGLLSARVRALTRGKIFGRCRKRSRR